MSDLIGYDPVGQLLEFQRQLLKDDFFGFGRNMHLPTTDIYTEDDKHMVIESHLPNFDQKDIDVHVDNGFLVIRAEKHEQEKDKKKQYIVHESSSSFYKRVKLPAVADKDAIKAKIKEGVLTVSVPFKALPEPKKIAIESSKK